MKELSKNDEARRAQIGVQLADKAKEVTEAHDTLEAAIAAYNEVVAAYNETVAEAQGWAEDIAREIEEHIDGRSDKWRESDKGEAFSMMRENNLPKDARPYEKLGTYFDSIIEDPNAEGRAKATAGALQAMMIGIPKKRRTYRSVASALEA